MTTLREYLSRDPVGKGLTEDQIMAVQRAVEDCVLSEFDAMANATDSRGDGLVGLIRQTVAAGLRGVLRRLRS